MITTSSAIIIESDRRLELQFGALSGGDGNCRTASAPNIAWSNCAVIVSAALVLSAGIGNAAAYVPFILTLIVTAVLRRLGETNADTFGFAAAFGVQRHRFAHVSD
jgi:hypothetical protein